ncbi:amino acid permease [Rhodococcus sp. H29-C3]|uniref:amino acid permease n=1 Tax=Rhodococcus sp. H29-C3 TaxID=3046307 RepID=UPI0024BB804B|nr:amino acid permease [Rhodococcus sp. H29-C3]MDJ0361927.1 amino acid permease [Rhodococcus sp. H29-C3]
MSKRSVKYPVQSTEGTHKLRGALRERQMTMIAIGGVIGAGLFVGSGSAIQIAGPATLVAYAAVGIVIVLVMRMLGEMSVNRPESGSFSSYASRELGSWAGLSVGWLYAYQWCITIGFEAVVGAAITHQMFPSIPTWLAAFVFMAALIAVNFTRVENFGTFEFWFAMIKVAAIVVFLLLGIAAILGMFPGVDAPGMSNLTGQGGFAPSGWSAVLTASLVVFFSFFGTEVVTIAAGEAEDPVRAVRTGINSVVWRILLFYVGSIIIIVTLLPWNSTQVAESPYSAVLSNLNIPYAGTAMNIIVLIAVLSCLNAGIYASSRMLFSLAARGEAPKILSRTTKSGVPGYAVFAASSVGLLTVVANYFLPTASVYEFLLNSAGGIAVVVYVCITATHIRSRMRMSAEERAQLKFKMWLFPALDILVLIVLIAVIGGMANNPSSRESLVLTTVVTAIAVTIGVIRQRYHRNRPSMLTSPTETERV